MNKMISIPSGGTRLSRDWFKKIEKDLIIGVPSFKISKYPVTNAEYRLFFEDGGYDKKQYWDDYSWSIKQMRDWSQPFYWDDADFNNAERFSDDEQPVVGVSWHEAIAYCNWLSEKTGDNITLPTEEQWQRAAQAMPDGSDSGYLYPWGNEWNHRKCNNSANGKFSRATTVVGHYEKTGNVSPCGVVDMAGNVLEMTRPSIDSKEYKDNFMVIRGGDWFSTNSKVYMTIARFESDLTFRTNRIGFRFVAIENI